MKVAVKPQDKASVQLDDRLFKLFDRLVPLIDNVSDGVRAIAVLSIVVAAWLFIWMFFVREFSPTTAVVIGGIVFLPGLILLRYWWSLQGVKDLPDIAEEIMNGVSDDVKSTWKAARSDKKKALSFIGQAKNFREMRSLLGQLDEVFGQYLNIGLLVNPLSLITVVVSVLSVLVLTLIGIVTALTSIL